MEGGRSRGGEGSRGTGLGANARAPREAGARGGHAPARAARPCARSWGVMETLLRGPRLVPASERLAAAPFPTIPVDGPLAQPFPSQRNEPSPGFERLWQRHPLGGFPPSLGLQKKPGAT